MFAVVATGVPWADRLIAVAALIVALGVIWTKAVRPVVRVARVLDQVLPVLIDIGQQFHENGGHSLKDSLNSIEAQLKSNGEQVSAQALTLAEQGTALSELEKYAHKYRHEQGNDITKLLLSDQAISAQLAQLSAKVSVSARTGDRIEAAQTVVAEDLAASVERADHAQGAEGAAADAASRSPNEET